MVIYHDFPVDDEDEDEDIMKPEEELSEQAKVLNAFRKASFTLPGEMESSDDDKDED